MLCTTLVLGAGSARAQDAHYWTNQYGARAGLLGGVVVGSLLDLSDAYYNPGALALASDPSLLLGTEAIELLSVTVDNGLGTGLDVSSTQLQPAPGFFAISFGSAWTLSVLTRQDFVFSTEGRRTDVRDLLPAPGDEFFSGEAMLNQTLRESWLGATWSKPVGSNVGARDQASTTFLALRSQRGRTQVVGQAVNPGGEGASLVDFFEFRYWNVRVLWKAGLAVDLSPLTLGLTLTTPSIDLAGSGSLFTNTSAIGFDAGGMESSQLVSSFQIDLDSEFRSPLSIAVGAAYVVGSTKIHTSAEWFNSVGGYQVLQGSEFEGQTTGDTLALGISQELRSIINFGFGLEHTLSDLVSLYGSFATDFSASSGRAASQLSITNWDIYQISAGSTFTVDRTSITLGLGFGTGNQTVNTDFTLDPGGLFETRPRDVDFRKLKLIAGVSLGL